MSLKEKAVQARRLAIQNAADAQNLKVEVKTVGLDQSQIIVSSAEEIKGWAQMIKIEELIDETEVEAYIKYK